MRRRRVSIAWADLQAALAAYVREGVRLARCRLTGGHRRGTWRLGPSATGIWTPNPSGVAPAGEYVHTWCRRCGWCEQTQSFSEEDEWIRDPSGTEPVTFPF